MLTPEERQHIEDEERKRIAEEQYRAEVRNRLKQSPTSPPEKKSGASFWMILLAVACGVIGIVIVSTMVSSFRPGASITPSSSVPSGAYVTATEQIASGQIVVKAGQYVRYPIHITPEMGGAHVAGNYNVSGGQRNDIDAVLSGEDEFPNWINGHQAHGYYFSNGKKTTDHFDVKLQPGDYVLAFSNKFSTFTDKQVFLDVNLKYSHYAK